MLIKTPQAILKINKIEKEKKGGGAQKKGIHA
jgi:hypothetical protein